MSKRVIAISAVVVALAAAFFLVRPGPTPDGNAARTATTPANSPARSESSASAGRNSAGVQPAGAGGPAAIALTDRTPFSVEEWILSLPLKDQARARQFAQSYGTAYQVETQAQRQWLLLHGYPSLEDAVSFDAEALTTCLPLTCPDPKVAALGADHILNDLESILASAYSGTELPEDYLGSLPQDKKIAFGRGLVDLEGYIRQARDQGSLMFAAHLRARLGRMTGNNDQAIGAEALLVACGDPRLSLQDPMARAAALGMLDTLPGGSGICGYRPGRPMFPR